MAEAQATPELKKSRVGKRGVLVPKGVTVSQSGRKLDISGPKGKLVLDLPEHVAVRKDGESWLVESSAEGRD
jgi:ribosomal protein L6P/L9E